jgi:hypothetical protein
LRASSNSSSERELDEVAEEEAARNRCDAEWEGSAAIADSGDDASDSVEEDVEYMLRWGEVGVGRQGVSREAGVGRQDNIG